VAQYRIEKLEAKNEELEKELKLLRDEFHAQGERVKCLICKAHDMECPGC
jgi:cell division protein FtsB